MAITAADRAKIQCVITYLDKGGSGKFLDATSIERLNRVFSDTCGFGCRTCFGTFFEGMRDKPWVTILRTMLCPDLAVISLAPDPVIPGAPVVPDPEGGLEFPGTSLFGILGAETVTNTGATLVTGDLGLSPGSSVTGFFPIDGGPGNITGTYHITDVAAANAQIAATAQYLFLAGMASTATVSGDIGGQTLAPGVYTAATSLAVTSADLTLDGGGDVNAVFVFQIGSTLTIANGRQIVLIGGAQAKNIYWQVGSSATLGTTSVFNGTIVALASVTATTGAVVNGRLIARTGAVTLDTNAVTVPV